MRLLTRLTLRLTRRQTHLACLLTWGLALVFLEVIGRGRDDELYDLGAIAALAVLAVATIAWHRRRALPSVDWLLARSQAAWSFVASRNLKWGADLRGEPPVPRGLPRRHGVALAALAASNLLALSLAGALPGALRTSLTAVSYVGYLALLALLWALLVAGAVVSAAVGVLFLQLLVARRSHMGWRLAGCAALLLCAVCTAALTLPGWLPLAVLAVLPGLFAAGTAGILAPLQLLWQRPGRAEVRSASSHYLNTVHTVLVCLAATLVALLAHGDTLLGTAANASSLPITRTAGTIFAWSAAAGVFTATVVLIVSMRRLARLSGHLGPREEITSRREFELRIEILRGFERLFAAVAHRRFEKGEGYWIGLQHWFIPGLGRDTEEDELHAEDSWAFEAIGPSFHAFFSPAARQCYAHTMQRLQIDLVFLEDGVGIAGLRRVLDAVFRVYDQFCGERRAEQHHFTGLAGVAVILHEFTLDAPLLRTGFAEPSYEDIGRARILHVFKERGEDDEAPELPSAYLGSRPLASVLL